MDIKPDNRTLAREFAAKQRERRDKIYADETFAAFTDARARADHAARFLWKKDSNMAVSPYHQTALEGIDRSTPATNFSGVQGLDALTRAYNVGTTTDTQVPIETVSRYIEDLNRLLPGVNMTVHRVDIVDENGAVVEAATPKTNPAGFTALRERGSDAGVYILKVSPRNGNGKAHRYIIGGSGYRSKFMTGSTKGREVFGSFFAGDDLKRLQYHAIGVALEAMGENPDFAMDQMNLAELKRYVAKVYDEGIKSIRRTNQGRIAAGIAKTVHPGAKSRNFADNIKVDGNGQINKDLIKGGPGYQFGQTMFRQHGGRCAPVGIHASASNTNASNARVKPVKRKFRNGNSTKEKYPDLHGQEYVACTMGGSMIPRMGPQGFTKGEKNSRYGSTAYRLGSQRGKAPVGREAARDAMFGGLSDAEARMRFVQKSNRAVQDLNEQMGNKDSWFGRTKGKKARPQQALGAQPPKGMKEEDLMSFGGMD